MLPTLTNHPQGYALTLNEAFSSLLLPPLSASTFAARHGDCAKIWEDQGKTAWGHRTVAVLQYTPGIGILTALAEILIAVIEKIVTFIHAKLAHNISPQPQTATSNNLGNQSVAHIVPSEPSTSVAAVSEEFSKLLTFSQEQPKDDKLNHITDSIPALELASFNSDGEIETENQQQAETEDEKQSKAKNPGVDALTNTLITRGDITVTAIDTMIQDTSLPGPDKDTLLKERDSQIKNLLKKYDQVKQQRQIDLQKDLDKTKQKTEDEEQSKAKNLGVDALTNTLITRGDITVTAKDTLLQDTSDPNLGIEAVRNLLKEYDRKKALEDAQYNQQKQINLQKDLDKTKQKIVNIQAELNKATLKIDGLQNDIAKNEKAITKKQEKVQRLSTGTYEELLTEVVIQPNDTVTTPSGASVKASNYKGKLTHSLALERSFELFSEDNDAVKFHFLYINQEMKYLSYRQRWITRAEVKGTQYQLLNVDHQTTPGKIIYHFETQWKGDGVLPWIKIYMTRPNKEQHEATIININSEIVVHERDMLDLQKYLDWALKDKQSLETDLSLEKQGQQALELQLAKI